MLSVTRNFGPSPSASERRTRPSAELDADLRTARAQMVDWVTCPSAKTPEGKAKIEEISTRLESVKQEIKKSDAAAPAAPGLEQAVKRLPSASSGDTDDDPIATTGIGLHVDTYA